jgi:long-chain fatty acid transport protein
VSETSRAGAIAPARRLARPQGSSRATAAFLVLLAAGTAHANPMDMFGFGARAPAMGGAATAAVDGAGATYYNPGALAAGDEIRIDLGYQAALPKLSINGGDQGVDSSRGLTAGLLVPGDLGPLHLAFGLAVHLPDEHVLRTRTMPSGRPRWVYYDNRPQRFYLAACIGLQILPNLWIGGGLTEMSRTKGTIDLNGRVGFPSSEDSTLDLSIDVSLAAERYVAAGILWRPLPWLDVGAAYRGGFVLAIDQGFAIHGNLGPANMPVVRDAFLSLQSLSLDLFQPEQVAVGMAARLTPRLLVSADAQYQRWSTFENPASVIEIQYDFRDFNNQVKIPGPVPLEPAYFHDTIGLRGGVEITAASDHGTTWLVRAGYAFDPSPAPEQRGETNFVDNDKHTLSLGLGLTLPGLGAIVPRPLDIDLYFAGTLLPERVHRKLSLIDPVGDYESQGYVLSGGVATRWRF